MPPDEDRVYYTRRAQEERDRADGAPDASVAAVHRWLASEYERRLAQLPQLEGEAGS